MSNKDNTNYKLGVEFEPCNLSYTRFWIKSMIKYFITLIKMLIKLYLAKKRLIHYLIKVLKTKVMCNTSSAVGRRYPFISFNSIVISNIMLD